MKIDAEVELNEAIEDSQDSKSVKVPVDIDYVVGREDAVVEWVKNALEEKFGRAFCCTDFTITNLEDIVKDIAYDEFCSKVL